MSVHGPRPCVGHRPCAWDRFVNEELWISHFRLSRAVFHACADQSLHLRLTSDIFFFFYIFLTVEFLEMFSKKAVKLGQARAPVVAWAATVAPNPDWPSDLKDLSKLWHPSFFIGCCQAWILILRVAVPWSASVSGSEPLSSPSPDLSPSLPLSRRLHSLTKLIV